MHRVLYLFSHQTCSQCRQEQGCAWSVSRKSCYAASTAQPVDLGTCPCETCQMWHDTEASNLTWLRAINQELPCPCTATFSSPRVLVGDGGWSIDKACNPWTGCKERPGAHGCLRSESTVHGRQQCCYDARGGIIPSGMPGAGTPDRGTGQLSDSLNGVKPYHLCCTLCEDPGMCSRYTGPGGVREGDTSHCLVA